MLSDETFAEITRLTEKALQELPLPAASDRVTVVRGYVQLLRDHPERQDYKTHLVDALLDLAEVASRHSRHGLASDLESLAGRIERES